MDKPTSVAQMKTRLLALLQRDALKKGKFVLSSGKESSFYLDGRIITMTPEGAYLIANLMLAMIKGDNVAALGGPTLGADPIVGAVAAVSHINGVALKTFIVRKSAKEHGTQRQVEGPALKPGERVVLVDDVATSGKSLIEAKKVMDSMNVTVVKALVIVDRNEGGRENLAAVGVALEPIFTLPDLGV
jgi:orotate phosphoribosyltransferase